MISNTFADIFKPFARLCAHVHIFGAPTWLQPEANGLVGNSVPLLDKFIAQFHGILVVTNNFHCVCR